MIDGDPWFVAADVCRALDLCMLSGTARHLTRLSKDERRVIVREGTYAAQSAGTLNRTVGSRELFGQAEHTLTVISESGLYKLLMRSDKPEARPFQDWVTRDVIPSIRKTGGYLLNEEARSRHQANPKPSTPALRSPERVRLPAPRRGAWDTQEKPHDPPSQTRVLRR